ncbi:splicing factor 3B subunit 2 [Trichonephila inaurata madagascariensis]|uniref:Splicing factor 3B subunit 2 n=1 Tax=Trichonephila inaurata madagascariensis TaxID=2747483 RepID=A0A8X7CNM8_9ARAC|nr:splicing factor 3B subunit 2 [Trichonephila inaurata madagascariensis]
MSSDEYMELPQGTEEVLPFKSERAHMFSGVPDAVAQPVTVGEEKGLPRDSSNEHLISTDEMCEIEEVKQKVYVNPNFKASSNIIFVQCHLCFKRNYSQVKRRVEKPGRKLPFIRRFGVMRRRPTKRKKGWTYV